MASMPRAWGAAAAVSSYDQSQMFTDSDSNGGGIDKGMTFEVLIGGAGGSAGNGGTVQVTNSGAINTSGEQASGIFAQKYRRRRRLGQRARRAPGTASTSCSISGWR